MNSHNKAEPLSEIGYTEERKYTLNPPFGIADGALATDTKLPA